MPLILAMPKALPIFLASLAWLAGGVLVGLFIYVPTHTPLSLGQATLAWVSVVVVLLSSTVALVQPQAPKVRLIAAVSIVVPCILAAVVAVGLIRGG